MGREWWETIGVEERGGKKREERKWREEECCEIKKSLKIDSGFGPPYAGT